MSPRPNRDLIILSRYAQTGGAAFEEEVRAIHHMLYHVEGTDRYCRAHEVIDVNHYRIIQKDYLVRKIISDRIKPFVFLFNKN
ncbi:MAG TPA: hypothetical protein VL053_11365 [Arachidicoccus sp.]|nr:hypothetical protein [Arachidicoccus sp.]